MAEGKERREHTRHEARFALKLGSDAAPADHAIATDGLNISMGGIYCLVPHHIPLMTKLQATLLLPMQAPERGAAREENILETEMIVVWSDPEAETPGQEKYKIGCAFLPLSPEQKSMLKRYLDSLD